MLGGALAACGNPEKSAQRTIDQMQAAIAAGKTDLNPQKQLDAYNDMVEKVESVGKDYAKTTVGKTIAAGGSVNGVSLAGVTALRDAMAARATCYADPSIVCLTPFSSHAGSAASNTSASGASAMAEQQVCSAGFAAADKALDAIKINPQAYAQELIQVALAAAKCERPNDVGAAVAQYIKANPAPGDARTTALLSVLATDTLKPAWPMITDTPEQGLAAQSITGSAAAGTLISLAVKCAKMGSAKAALARYATLTDTLHYQADSVSQDTLVSALILDGETDTALQIAGVAGNQDTTAVTLHHAAVALGTRIGFTRDAIGAAPNLGDVARPGLFHAGIRAREGARRSRGSDARSRARQVGTKGGRTAHRPWAASASIPTTVCWRWPTRSWANRPRPTRPSRTPSSIASACSAASTPAASTTTRTSRNIRR